MLTFLTILAVILGLLLLLLLLVLFPRLLYVVMLPVFFAPLVWTLLWAAWQIGTMLLWLLFIAPTLGILWGIWDGLKGSWNS